MPTGDITLLQTLPYEINSVCNDGTYVYEACSDGWLRSYAISGGAVVALAHFDDKMVAIQTDNTYVFIAFKNGRVKKYAISGGAITEIGTATMLSHFPTAMTFYSNDLYVAQEGGYLRKLHTLPITSLSPSISPSKSPSLSSSISPSKSPSISPSRSPSISPSPSA
jgi:hypothetical protein